MKSTNKKQAGDGAEEVGLVGEEGRDRFLQRPRAWLGEAGEEIADALG